MGKTSAQQSTDQSVSDFISRWQNSDAAERANYQLFLSELCDILEVPRPNPTVADDAKNEYVFERNVHFDHGDGTSSVGRIDLYRRGCFVLEAKQGSSAQSIEPALFGAQTFRAAGARKGTAQRGTPAWDVAMLKARTQAEQYVRALPAPEGNPPFVLVVDVGHTIEIYSDFSRLGKTYTPFPDSQSHRIKLADLAQPEVRQRLARIWTDPIALDPARQSAKVTRDIAAKLAVLAKSLELAGHHPESVAHFLMRCLFTLFAEDVELIKDHAFTKLLESLRGHPEQFPIMVREVWKQMDTGDFSLALRQKLLRFNGGLFEESEALPLNEAQLKLLIDAAICDWSDVEPAIFGTLLERALDERERHKLGAHYTPRAYVERLVLPTVIEPLREQWDAAKAAAFTLNFSGKPKEAIETIEHFLADLCHTRVLDPACGSGNFLYVTMEHMKRIEGEVRDVLAQLAPDQQFLELRGLTVDPHQFLGLEINPRAVAIADLVLWIGYLKWHFRTYGKTMPAEPVLRKFDNIKQQDAVLAYDRQEIVTDEKGKPVTRWDGRTMKTSPVTGEDIPDESARVPVYRYVNPRKAEWPKADYVVGNPPFLGQQRMRRDLGDGYVDALRAVHADVPETIDFVMLWWNHAATSLSERQIRSFGFVTTNKITQPMNRKVIERYFAPQRVLRLKYAVPDHPWVDEAESADVRIAMTAADTQLGELGRLTYLSSGRGSRNEDDDTLDTLRGQINADLTLGVELSSCVQLRSNDGLAIKGFELGSQGFLVDRATGGQWIAANRPLSDVLRPYMNGKDLTRGAWRRFVIDFFGLTETEAREHSQAYQYVYDRVRPERAVNREARTSANWWLFRRAGTSLRKALKGLPRFIGTTRTAKYRLFQFLPAQVLAESKIVVIASDDGYIHGVLSSRIHELFATKIGGWLGVGDDPTYNHEDCFNKFPFPDCSEPQKQVIRKLGEDLDAHRKRQQAAHPGLTITDMYNVLEKLRKNEPLSEKEKKIHADGLVSVLKQIHDDLDAAVAAAYGWPADLTDEQILAKLVALNHERAEEERRGIVRWLRPEFQNPSGKTAEQQHDLPMPKAAVKTQPEKKLAWPKALAEQIQALRGALSASATPATAKELASRFKGASATKIAELLTAMQVLGQARALPGERYAA